jgi:hypothetical protein
MTFLSSIVTFKKWQQLVNVDGLNRSRLSLYKNGTIDWELLYVNNFEGTLSWLGQVTQIWIANVMTDENFVIDAEFMRNAFAVSASTADCD